MIATLIELRDHVDAWMRSRLWAQVLAGLVLGILVGYLLGPDLSWVERETAEAIARWLALPGNVFLGLLPLLVASGAGSASRRALGTAVFGGMLLSTVIGVFLTPVFFVLVQKLRDRSAKAPTPAAASAGEAS